jgi:hypothetical protein
MKKFLVKVVLAIVLVGGAVVVLDRWMGDQRGGLLFSSRPAISDKATLAILRSEAMSFLGTRRTATQIVVEHEESNWLGEWNGVLWATVSWQWGVDLSKLTEKDIRRDGEKVICHLPEPELLAFVPDFDSIRFMSKSTAVPKILNFFRDGYQRKVLESKLREQAMKFADEQGLRPSRQEIVRQLNDAVAVWKTAAGIDIQFE